MLSEKIHLIYYVEILFIFIHFIQKVRNIYVTLLKEFLFHILEKQMQCNAYYALKSAI